MNLSLWLSIFALIVSFSTFIGHAWLYRRMSQSQVDDNIMNATNSILLLLEKAKTLGPAERRLLMLWLHDWEYFAPPRFILRHKGPKVTPATIEELRQYFYKLVEIEGTDKVEDKPLPQAQGDRPTPKLQQGS
jgi:hypothetical protein